MIKRGTIVLIPFPFTDLSSQRIRPALVVSNDERGGGDVIVVFITSVLSGPVGRAEVLIRDTHPSFAMTGLKVSSQIKCDKIATLDRRIAIGELGAIPVSIQKEVDVRLRAVLSLGSKKTLIPSGGGRRQ